MKLQLLKPLVFFDLESTGLNVSKDQIVEMMLIKVFPNGDIEKFYRKLKPLVPISPEAEAVHGISLESLKDAPTFKDIVHELIEFIKGCDFAHFNGNNFDMPLLQEELIRSGHWIDLKECYSVDVQAIYKKMEPRNLKAAVKFYTGQEIQNWHSAEADVLSTIDVLEGQVSMYDLPKNVVELAELSTNSNNVDFSGMLINDENGNICFNFGKYKGYRVSHVAAIDLKYINWFLAADFPQYTKYQLHKAVYGK